jgi:hypothetical protein
VHKRIGLLQADIVFDAVQIGLAIGGAQRIDPAEALFLADDASALELAIGFDVTLDERLFSWPDC